MSYNNCTFFCWPHWPPNMRLLQITELSRNCIVLAGRAGSSLRTGDKRASETELKLRRSGQGRFKPLWADLSCR